MLKKLCETIGANNYLLETLFSLAGVRFFAYKGLQAISQYSTINNIKFTKY